MYLIHALKLDLADFCKLAQPCELLGGEWTTWSVLHSISFQPLILTYQQPAHDRGQYIQQLGSNGTPSKWSTLIVIIS